MEISFVNGFVAPCLGVVEGGVSININCLFVQALSRKVAGDCMVVLFYGKVERSLERIDHARVRGSTQRHQSLQGFKPAIETSEVDRGGVCNLVGVSPRI